MRIRLAVDVDRHYSRIAELLRHVAAVRAADAVADGAHIRREIPVVRYQVADNVRLVDCASELLTHIVAVFHTHAVGVRLGGRRVEHIRREVPRRDEFLDRRTEHELLENVAEALSSETLGRRRHAEQKRVRIAARDFAVRRRDGVMAFVRNDVIGRRQFAEPPDYRLDGADLHKPPIIARRAGGDYPVRYPHLAEGLGGLVYKLLPVDEEEDAPMLHLRDGAHPAHHDRFAAAAWPDEADGAVPGCEFGGDLVNHRFLIVAQFYHGEY